MQTWLSGLDALLRGRHEEVEHMPVRPHLVAVVVFGGTFGIAMGLFAALTREPGSVLQVLSSALKVPAIFLLTLVVTLPSLVVFGAVLDLPLSSRDAFRVTLAASAVAALLLASLAPITAFFTFCTTSYPFMKLLDFAFFALAGAIGIAFLSRHLGRLAIRSAAGPADSPTAEKERGEAGEGAADGESAGTGAGAALPPPGALSPGSSTASSGLLRVWIVLFLLVAIQMAWVLRPLVGSPDKTFSWFEPRGGSFLRDFFTGIGALLAR